MSRIKSVALIALFTLTAVMTTIPATARGTDPYVVAWIGGAELVGAPDRFVSGQDYEVGDLVDLYINGVFFGTSVAEPNAEGTASPYFEAGFEAGDEIKLVRQSDGLEKVLIAYDLDVVWASSIYDVIAGSGERRSEILALAGDFSGDFQRTERVDRFRRFFADFSEVGDAPEEQVTIDLMPGGLAAVLHTDADGDITAHFAEVTDESHEPAVRRDCRRGGWKFLVKDDGTPFRSMWACFRYRSAFWSFQAAPRASA